jgi:hypothetical protein
MYTACSDENFLSIRRNILKKDCDQIDLNYYIAGCTERQMYSEALVFAEMMRNKGDSSYYSFIAEYLYDYDAPLKDDDLWCSSMNIAIEKNTILDVGAWENQFYDEACGLWLLGHIDKSSFQDFALKHYKVKIPPNKIQHGYLTKNGANYTYSDTTPKGSHIPITTTLDLMYINAIQS